MEKKTETDIPLNGFDDIAEPVDGRPETVQLTREGLDLEDLLRWVEWAKGYADSVDPLLQQPFS